MKPLTYNNNLQPQEIAADKVYFINMLQESNFRTYYEASTSKEINPVVSSIIKKLRPAELNVLIQMIENIR